MAMFIVKPWYRKKDDAIYGAEWAGGSDPSWVRTDAAVGFSDPNPYYSGMSTTPSSPFDNIMPWAGMRRVTDANAGELVEIPKFYYKWTRDGVKMKLQISMKQFDGSHVSPAHSDRGDGVGERDYVYIGRYLCASDYKSKTGVTPITSITRATARSAIHNLGSNVWQFDYATFWTVCMLYLVEYATWDSQSAVGYGGGSVNVTGYTDNMPYHTGTSLSSRTSYGLGIQYRYIEGLWNVPTIWYDGIYFNGSNAYGINNPSAFSDSSGGTLIGTRVLDGYELKSYTNSTIQGYEYCIVPNATARDSNFTTYIGDYVGFASADKVLSGLGDASGRAVGLFAAIGREASATAASVGSRLMVLPPSRLSA